MKGYVGSALIGASLAVLLLALAACGSSEDKSPHPRDAGHDAADASRDASDAALDAPDAGPAAFVIGQPDEITNRGVQVGLALPNDAVIVGSRLLVADQSNNRVLIWNTLPTQNQQAADIVLGHPDFTTSVPNYDGVSPRSFWGSNGAMFDGTRLVVADRFNHRVLIWNTFPTKNFQPADVVLGQPDFRTASANTGGISASSMTEPWVWLGGSKLFVSDRYNYRVLIWNTIPTQNNAPADVVLGQPNMTSAVLNNGGVSASSLADPGRGWVDGARLFVPDLANHRVLIWDTIPTTNNAPANRVLGQTNLTSNGPNAGGAVGGVGLNSPIAVFAAGNRVAVADYLNHRVLVWTTALSANGQAANLVLGQTTFAGNTENAGGLSASSLLNPNSVSGDGTRLVVSDRFNHRVLFWNSWPSANAAPASFALGQPDLVSGRFNNAGAVSASSLSGPQSLTQAGARLAVADTERARVLVWSTAPTSAGVPADLVLGQPDFASFGLFGDSTSARSLCAPVYVHSDGTRLAVGEQCARRISIWNSIPTTNHTPIDLAVGQPDLTSSTANNGGVSASSLAAGRVQPHLDGTRLFVADPNNHRVLIWTALPTTTGAPANLVLGQPNMTSAVANNGGLSALSLAQPNFVYASNGKLFVVDTNNHRVLVWNAIPTTNHAPADLVIGQPDMTTGAEAPASARTLRSPRSVHVDGSGRLYVVDAGNHRILYWNAVPTANGAAADGVLGQADFSSAFANNGGLSARTLQAPSGVIAIGDRIYIVDSGNNRVLVLPRP